MRAFKYESTLEDGSLALALAPALTPTGVEKSPIFFRGIAKHPQILARGLLVLADITATRYFKYVPDAQRDPVLSAQGDRLRAECFSACNGVYARLDLLSTGFEGEIGFGTTNVDIGMTLRTALTGMKQKDKFHLLIGSDGFTTSQLRPIDDTLTKLEKVIHERPVQMPDRWIRALGNTAEIHRKMKPVLTLKGIQAKGFLTTLPPATGKDQSGWVTPTPTGAKLMPRPSKSSAYISGLHRLSALKRIMTHVTQITFYMLDNLEPGPSMIELTLPDTRLTISLTGASWQGYSGEGALLESLAQKETQEDAEKIKESLAFDAIINEKNLAEEWNISRKRVQSALALLAVSGRVGFDASEQAYFHRELPDDPNRILKDNPRLVGAKKLVDNITKTGKNNWIVSSQDANYLVHYEENTGAHQAKCTCTWYLNHQNKRGPCKHILAIQLKKDKSL